MRWIENFRFKLPWQAVETAPHWRGKPMHRLRLATIFANQGRRPLDPGAVAAFNFWLRGGR